MLDIYETSKKLLNKGEDLILAKVVQTSGSTPRKKGAWLLMSMDEKTFGTVGGGKIEALVEEICRKTFITKESKSYKFSLTPEEQKGIDMRCGGEVTVSIEYINHLNPELVGAQDKSSKAFIYGAGHIGKEIAEILKYVGFATVVLDDRPEFANKSRFPDADEIIVMSDFNQAFSEISTGPDSYIIIVTRGHSADYDVLKQALLQENEYIGMIGSRKKISVVYEQLFTDGFSKEDLKKVHSPIGLKIGAETPEEIAISIAAEMIKIRAELSITSNISV